jgi:flagellar hook protein FlgE
MNLDATAPAGTKFKTSIQVFDTLGNAHTATLSMQKDVSAGTPPQAVWRYDVTIPNNQVAGVASTDTQDFSLMTGAVATTPPSAGALVFDNSGKLTSAYAGADPATLPALANISIPGTGVSLPQLSDGASLSPKITWQLLDSTTSLPNVTAFAGANAVNASSQNGSSAGTLNSLSIQSDGTISAMFSNGANVNVGQIALARFSNADGLVAQGGGLFRASDASGTALVGVPGVAGRGTLAGSTLEQSNVDLATELTKIITFQRGYQASAKIITATDQIMQDTINMKQ